MIFVSSRTEYSITCGVCGFYGECLFSDDGFNKKGALKEWRKQGWIIGHKHICPNCSKKETHRDRKDI